MPFLLVLGRNIYTLLIFDQLLRLFGCMSLGFIARGGGMDW